MPTIQDFSDLAKNAIIDTIVPSTSDLDIEEALSHDAEEEPVNPSPILPSIGQRQTLFFDESVTVHVVLKLSNCSEDLLKELLPKLNIKVDVLAVSSQLLTHDGKVSEVMGQTSEVVFSDVVKDTEDPLVVVHDSDGEDEGTTVFAFWKLDTFLNRPRTRIQNFSIMFAASATLNPAQIEEKVDDSDDYMESLVPAPFNLLGALKGDPSLSGDDPYLPDTRLTRVVPVAKKEKPVFHIRPKAQTLIRVVPAVSARIRYSRLNTHSSKLTTIASLDFEVTPLASHDVVLARADLRLLDGSVQKIAASRQPLELPIICKPRDDITFLYKLTPDYDPAVNPTTTAIFDTLDISIESMVKVSPVCRPRILMRWRANVDFSMPVNPTFGGPSQGLQRNNRPASIPVTPAGNTAASTTSVPSRNSGRVRAQSTTDLGVTITFSGPEKVEVGKKFHWEVFIVNNSSKARKLSIVAIPRRRRGDVRKHASKTSSSSAATIHKDEVVAEAVADESIVYAMQKNSAMQGTELVCVSTELRIGSLQPGSCHATELKFLPLAAGSLHLEAVRVVDVLTNEATDIRDLPDIVALDREGGSLTIP